MSFATLRSQCQARHTRRAPQTGDLSDWIWQYEETERIIRSVSPRPGAPSSAAYMGSGRLCRRSRPGPSFLRAHSAMLYWLRVRADHEAHPRRERRQRAVDRNRRDVAAPAARRRGRDAAEHEVVADRARFRRRPAHPGGRGQARRAPAGGCSATTSAQTSTSGAARRISSCGRSWRRSSSRRRSSSSGAASACSCSGSTKERSSACTRRASSSGSGRRRFTC